MKSLYESILDVADTELDDASKKLLIQQLDLQVEGTGENSFITSLVLMSENTDRELAPWSAETSEMNIPSFAELFPQGCTIRRAAFTAEMRYKHLNKHKLSELAKHKIYIHHFDIDAKDYLDALDTKVGVVELTYLASDISLNYSTFKRISKYTDAAIVNFGGFDTKIKYKPLMDMKNCPLSTLIITGGFNMFGDKSVKVGLWDNITLIDAAASRISEWMKNNPKTDLLLSTSAGDVSYAKMRFNSKGELAPTYKLTPKEQNILI